MLGVGIGIAPTVAPAAPGGSNSAQRDAFFREGKIPRLDIDVGPKGLEKLRANPREYVEATIRENGEILYSKVGVHLRGSAGSFRGVDDKPGFTINMDKWEDGQRFYGMEKFHLANSAQDGSYCNELIASEIYRAAGVPAARCSHAIVTLNGRKLGFYYFKEGYDDGFIKSNFANSGGNFYDGGFLRDIDQELQLDPGKKDPAKDRAELKAVVEMCREKDHARRIRKLDQMIEMDKFLAMCAVQVITFDWDSYALKPNNYRIYHDPKTNKLTFIPSGMDQLWGDLNFPIVPGFGGMLARAILETDQGKQRYLVKFREVTEKAFPGNTVKIIEALEARLKAAFEPYDKGAANNVLGSLQHVKNCVIQRSKNVNEQLQKMQAKK